MDKVTETQIAELAKQIATENPISYTDAFATVRLLYLTGKLAEARRRYEANSVTFYRWATVTLHCVNLKLNL